MAAGRHGDADFEVSRKRDFHYSSEEHPHFRSVDWENGRGQDLVQVKRHNFRDRVRVRQRDIKERDAVNGYHSSSSTSNSGSSENSRKQSRFSVRSADREPGELSSGSGSDDADVSDSQIGANENLKYENGARSPPGKRRKFSPIVWDREEKEARGSYRNKTDSPSVLLPPPPPLPRSFRPTPVANRGEVVGLSPVRSNNLVGSVVSESPADVSLALPLENHWNNDQETGQLEEEDYDVPTRNISSSRWADEGEVSDEEGMLKQRKKTPVVETLDTRLNTEASSPEFGELTRKGSERARSKSLESDEDRTSGTISKDELLEVDAIKIDFMEVDDKNLKGDDDTSHISGTDSEEHNDFSMTPELSGPPQRSINMLQGCRSVDEFERLNKIDEGTYGVVYRVKDKKTGEIVALKKVKMEKEREGFPLTSLREINILLSLHHPSVVDVKEVVVGNVLDNIFMVMEYMEHDLKGLMETMKQPFSQSEVKCLMLQLLEGVKYLHDNWVLHRDLKTSNILLNNRGELKICDFGLSRQYGSPLKPYTHLVVTLWYRAPELLLGAKQYSTAIDMWSLGCIMAELLAKEPLFNGKSEFDQLDKIFRTLGTPNEKIWPGFVKLPGVKVNFVKQPYNKLRDKFPPTSFSGRPTLSEAGMDLLNKLLTYDPDKRITAEDALNHEWFREVPLPKSKDFMPTFPAQHAQDRRSRRIMKSPDPLEEQRRKELQQAESGTGGLFG